MFFSLPLLLLLLLLQILQIQPESCCPFQAAPESCRCFVEMPCDWLLMVVMPDSDDMPGGAGRWASELIVLTLPSLLLDFADERRKRREDLLIYAMAKATVGGKNKKVLRVSQFS